MNYNIVFSEFAFRDLKNPIILKQDADRIVDRLNNLSESPYLGIKISNSFIDGLEAYYYICLNRFAIYHIDEKNKNMA